MELLHEGSKVVHEAIVENAAQTNIKTRANNPKNGQGRSPKYLFVCEHTSVDVTANELTRTKGGRSIERIAVAAASFHWQFMTISSGIKAVNGEAWALSPDHKSIVISPNDSNASSNSDLPPRKLESSLDAAVAVTQRANIPPPPSTALSLLLRILII